MKERKPLFPEYIWMFFVGLLLAIIICMRLLPGQAAFYEEPQLNNVIYVRIAGKTLYFGDTDCEPATAVINENGITWTDALISDINYNLVLLNAKFGVGNFSVFIIDDYAVTYCYEKLAALLYANNIYCYSYVSEIQTGTTSDGEPYTIWSSPWNYSYAQTYWTQYYNYNTFILSDFTIGYYTQIDEYVSPTPTLSPTPTPEASEPCFTYCVKCDTSYYLVDIYGEVGYDLQANTDTIFNQVASDYSSTDRTLLRPCFIIKNGRSDGTSANWSFMGPYIIFYGQFNSFVKAVSYNMGSAYISDFDYVRSTFTAIDVPESYSYEDGYLGYQLQTLTDGGFCLGLWTRGAMRYASYPSVVEYCDFEYVTSSFTYSDSNVSLDPFMSYINAYYPTSRHNYYLSLVARLGLSTDSPVEGDATPTPSPTATPTQAPYVEVILPSPTPGPTAPVSFNDSDLPGGASGAGGSISSNDGASSSTADGVYNYWSYVLSQNQALAFIASFFQILPFELVYSLGSLIFILILIAMARLFIHFIE